MIRRLFDIFTALAGIVVLSPLYVFAALGILIADGGPVLYRAERVGRDGKIFIMHKFRTMRVNSAGSAITSGQDPRVFSFGKWLRILKIDELPQLFDVLRGVMSVVGPRPEDPSIVRDHYNETYSKTLRILPGLASPGSIYGYTHDQEIPELDTMSHYVSVQLPVKLALDTVYMQRQSLKYDLQICGRTMQVILARGLGKTRFPDPPEMSEARNMMEDVSWGNVRQP